ncbi:MAG: DUF2141 domain-containing protein [Flavobacteriales bacterium]|jgi:uncharacterized protein (DUF2141 family)|nr:DUF2141 domain-containing protein [Flavobacteriales bacterium]
MKAIILSLMSLLMISNGFSQKTTEVNLTFTHAQSQKGYWMVAIYKDAKTFLGDAPFTARRMAVSKGNTMTFELPRGEYAVAMFQDINDNKNLDRNSKGIPTEPYSFSGENIFPLMAKPTFEMTKFKVKRRKVALDLAIQSE